MSTDDEIKELLRTISERKFFARIDHWRRASLPAGGMAERVGGSRNAKLPAFDRLDEQLNAAEVSYRAAIAGCIDAWEADPRDYASCLEHLRAAEMLERKWLVPIAQLDAEQLKALDLLISDASSCGGCEITKEAWLHKQRQEGRKRSLWRLKKGLCGACYQADRRDRLAVLAVMDPDPMEVAS